MTEEEKKDSEDIREYVVTGSRDKEIKLFEVT